MLRLVRLVEQWQEAESELPEGWSEARLRLRLEDERRARRAAAVLAPANPGRNGAELAFFVGRMAGGIGPEGLRRLLRRLDREGIAGTLELVSATAAETPPAEPRRPTLVSAWESELAALPEDWSDIYAEVRFRSSDQLDRAALLVAPLNPTRPGREIAFRFRCARRFGYGASPLMVHRCLERCDAERIAGTARIVHALSDTKPVSTQGPVWYVGGKAV